MTAKSFKAWLVHARATDDAAGDWIADSRTPSVLLRMPKNFASAGEIRDFMREVGDPCQEALDAVEEVWRRYQGAKT